MTEEKEGFELSFKNKIVRVYFWIIVPAAILNIFLILFTNVPSIITSLFSVVTLVGFFVWLIIYLRKQKNKQNSEQLFVLSQSIIFFGIFSLLLLTPLRSIHMKRTPSLRNMHSSVPLNLFSFVLQFPGNPSPAIFVIRTHRIIIDIAITCSTIML